MQQQMYSPASSPGPTHSDMAASPKKGGFLDSIKRALPAGGRPDSPASSFGGSLMGSEAGGGTPKSRMFPNFSNGQRKREVIKKLEEDLSLLHLQVRASKAAAVNHDSIRLLQLLQPQIRHQGCKSTCPCGSSYDTKHMCCKLQGNKISKLITTNNVLHASTLQRHGMSGCALHAACWGAAVTVQ